MVEVFKSSDLQSFMYMLNPKDIPAPTNLRPIGSNGVLHQPKEFSQPSQEAIAQQQMQSDKKL